MIQVNPVRDKRTGTMVSLDIELWIAKDTYVDFSGYFQWVIAPFFMLLIPIPNRPYVLLKFFSIRFDGLAPLADVAVPGW